MPSGDCCFLSIGNLRSPISTNNQPLTFLYYNRLQPTHEPFHVPDCTYAQGRRDDDSCFRIEQAIAIDEKNDRVIIYDLAVLTLMGRL